MNGGSIGPFQTACGITGPLQVTVESPGREPLRRIIWRPFLLIGRSADADLCLADPAVSSKHAYLQLVEGQAFCVDLQSRTGTRWDGVSASSGWLRSRQTLAIGPFRIRLLGGLREDLPDAPEPLSPILRRLPAKDPLPGVSLDILSGQSDLAAWRMDRALALVGQASRCKLRLREPGMAGFHCSLLRTPLGLWVISLMERQGVSVNGTGVPWARLSDGDQLQIGSVLLSVRYHRPAQLGLESPVTNHPVLGWEPDLPPLRGGRMWPPLAPPSHAQPLPPDFPTAGQNDPSFPAVWPENTAVPSLSVQIPLAQHFAQMQQQMHNQFTQAVLTLGQMFGHLQREQLALIREELERLRHLTETIQALQTELVTRAPAPGAGAQRSTLSRTDNGPGGSVGGAAGGGRRRRYRTFPRRGHRHSEFSHPLRPPPALPHRGMRGCTT